MLYVIVICQHWCREGGEKPETGNKAVYMNGVSNQLLAVGAGEFSFLLYFMHTLLLSLFILMLKLSQI